jgi:hypothetical protein
MHTVTKPTKPQKILAVMFELCRGENKALQYEDIVVAAFKRYPEDFQLRGYPEYPDSSDIHKPLYEMKSQGLVRSANKTFELTARGIDVASKLLHSEVKDSNRLTKQEENEIDRVLNSAAFRLFQEGRSESILDTDFYEYLGITVRTSRANCYGRLTNVEHAIAAHSRKKADKLSAVLESLHLFLISRFKGEIDSRK